MIFYFKRKINGGPTLLSKHRRFHDTIMSQNKCEVIQTIRGRTDEFIIEAKGHVKINVTIKMHISHETDEGCNTN